MQPEHNINKYNSGIDNNCDKVKEFRSYNILARKALWEGDISSAYQLFDKAHSLLGCGYCKLMMGEKDDALNYLLLIKDSSPAVNWLIELIKFLNSDESSSPTYMQIKNFYEQDLNMLFKYNQNEYVNKIIKGNTFFECYNKEIYKYTARVLLNYDLVALAETYIKKSLDIYYNDPETHFILGEIYMKNNKIENAKYEYKKSNEVIGVYLPAQKRLNDLNRI